MAGVTDVSASSPQSLWLDELADVHLDWDSISPSSTPPPTTSCSTAHVASFPHGMTDATSCQASSSSTDDQLFRCTAEEDNLFSDLAASLPTTAPISSSSRPNPSSSNLSPPSDMPRRIMRATFPPALKSNSPIPGLSSSLRLRTLFCLGEALNVGCQAARENNDILLEVYCRVMSSHREGNIQHFVLADLTHDNPPFINATYAA